MDIIGQNFLGEGEMGVNADTKGVTIGGGIIYLTSKKKR